MPIAGLPHSFPLSPLQQPCTLIPNDAASPPTFNSQLYCMEGLPACHLHNMHIPWIPTGRPNRSRAMPLHIRPPILLMALPSPPHLAPPVGATTGFRMTQDSLHRRKSCDVCFSRSPSPPHRHGHRARMNTSRTPRRRRAGNKCIYDRCCRMHVESST